MEQSIRNIFFGDPSLTYKGLLDLLEEHNFEAIGAGCSRRAYGRDDLPYVVKVPRIAYNRNSSCESVNITQNCDELAFWERLSEEKSTGGLAPILTHFEVLPDAGVTVDNMSYRDTGEAIPIIIMERVTPITEYAETSGNESSLDTLDSLDDFASDVEIVETIGEAVTATTESICDVLALCDSGLCDVHEGNIGVAITGAGNHLCVMDYGMAY